MPSIYGSGDDEDEICRLTDPDLHPAANDEEIAMREQELLSNTGYDDTQDEMDESASLPHDLTEVLQQLSDDQVAEVIRFLERLTGH